jgi:AmmeMemoRadiSam system protein B
MLRLTVNFEKQSRVLLTSLLIAIMVHFVLPGAVEKSSAASSTADGSTADCLPPLFAGAWYDKEPSKLKASLDKLFANASARPSIDQTAQTARPLVFGVRSKSVSGKIIAAIVPHASYQYSGSTAAAFYGKVRGQKVTRVFIIGPAHREHFHGCALPVNKYMCSPLGKLPLDIATVRRLQAYHLFSAPYDRMKKEHSIEMQLPLIQHVFGVVSIVPIEVGQLQDVAEVRTVAKLLRRFIRPTDLIVVSSDFTHYGPRYKFQPFGKDPIKDIRTLDTSAFESIYKRQPGNFIEFQKETHDTICGLYPCAILLAMLPAHCEASLLDYENSSGVNKAPDGNMVSYMTIVFTEKKAGSRH